MPPRFLVQRVLTLWLALWDLCYHGDSGNQGTRTGDCQGSWHSADLDSASCSYCLCSSSHSLCRCGPEHCQQTASRTCNCREIVNNLDFYGSQYPSKYLLYTPLLCGSSAIKPDYSKLEPLWQSGLVHLSTKIVARFQFPAEPKFIFPIRDWESGCCPLHTVYYWNRGIFLHSW